MLSLAIKNLWITVLATSNAEGCLRQVSGQKQKEFGRAGAVAESLPQTGMPSNFQQLIFQGMWVKYFPRNFFG